MVQMVLLHGHVPHQDLCHASADGLCELHGHVPHQDLCHASADGLCDSSVLSAQPHAPYLMQCSRLQQGVLIAIKQKIKLACCAGYGSGPDAVMGINDYLLTMCCRG